MGLTEHYDAVIIGGGIGGLMCAWRLSEKKKDAKIIILERGADLENRSCPILSKKTEKCLHCKPCAIMEGMAGAGAFSDGKYNITTEYGGWLPDVMDESRVMEYILQADRILMEFGAQEEVFEPDDSLKALCIRHDLFMQQGKVKHLGTDANYETMRRMIEELRRRVTIRTMADVKDVERDSHTVIYVQNGTETRISGEKVIFAVGRIGNRMFQDWCDRNGISRINNQVDIGVRVEVPYEVWEPFSSRIYEPKILYRTKQYTDRVRMFCFNERGHVVTENSDGILTVNGHSYKDPAKRSANSNFALLSSTHFTSPFNEPVQYARHVASLANEISGGSVLVQRLGDLERGRRSTAFRMKESYVKPTLKAVPGDLSLCMPKRQLDNIVETLHALDQVAPGTANYDTLLYGIECKYYSARPDCRDFELTAAKGIFALGDGAGFTRSLSQAAANGLIVADIIAER
ncbi:MAG: NAD(P)-binding protein [Solobacterium sp.]|nr:NAD(P)-binding protein [Solobacterium sp.]